MKPEPHAGEHAVRKAALDDRIRSRPRSLREYVKWLQGEYGLEPPPKLHDGRLMDDHGDPRMTGEAKGWLGFGQDGPQDWPAIAYRKDQDGYYLTPMRAALESLSARYPEHIGFVLAVATNLFVDIKDIAAPFGWSAATGNIILRQLLPDLWDLWQPRPLPRVKWTEKSDAQKAAEDAA